MAASGGIYNGHHQLIARSRNVYGPYEASPFNPFIAQMDPANPIQHHGHAKLVQTQHGEWWALYLCQRRLDGFSTLGRETGLDRVDWREDGWPVINDGKGPSNTNPSPRLPASPQENPRSDDFSAAILGTQWQWTRNPDPAAHSLTERPGFLRLRGSTIPVDAPHARHILVQREVSHRYSAATRLEFTPRSGDQAGLICYYDSKSHIMFGLTHENGPCLQLRECRKGVGKHLAAVPLPADTRAIELRVQVDGLKRAFSYRAGNGDWQPAAEIPDATFLSDEGTPLWGFTGSMVGVFATRPDAAEPFAADFDFFHHEPR
jgi:xylan 1,4-beta-xylosidase